MKKLSYGAVLLPFLLSSTCVSADDFSGFRLGGGISNTNIEVVEDVSGYDFELYGGDYGNGFKIESGYDINQIFGVAVSYETNNQTLNNTITEWDVEGETFKVAADIGYAFPIQEVFLKPYGKLGFVHYSEEGSFRTAHEKDNDSSVFLGLGVRFQYKHFYTDLSIDLYRLDLYDTDYLNFNYMQTALTAGYKF